MDTNDFNTNSTEQEESGEAQTNFLGMSDEEFMNTPPPEVEMSTEEVIEDPIEDTDSEEDVDEEQDEVEEEEAEESSEEEESEALEDESDEDEVEDTEVNYEELYKQITAPFKANGKDMQVDSPEEAIQLMQMGANYGKKMASLKPVLKIAKMLENNELLDEDKVNFLIDLDKKNPEAIAKLLKEGNIDPLDVDADSSEAYQPNLHKVSEQQMEMDTVLEKIQHTPTFAATANAIKQWDEQSKERISEMPSIIEAINVHMGNGMYEQINSIMEKERAMGRLIGVSDIDAYKMIGDNLYAKALNNGTQQQQPNINANANVITKPVTKSKPQDPQLKNRKNATKNTRSKPSTKKQEFNPLSMSDEEFLKMTEGKFY